MKTQLTTMNVNIGIKIQEKNNPGWGTFIVKSVYDNGLYIIRGVSGERLLADSEFKFWNIIT